MFKFAIRDFRGFKDTGFVDVRPLTFLIGENSAGKSSFLAGLKYVIDFYNGQEASFNKDPFQLGTFEQIAYFRQGRPGRAKSFYLSTCMSKANNSTEGVQEGKAIVELKFEKGDSQALISSVSIMSSGDCLSISSISDKISTSYTSRNGETISLDYILKFPRIPRSQMSRYWPFFLQDISLRLRDRLGVSEGVDIPQAEKSRIEKLRELAGRISLEMSGPAEATSAIRTKPLRTYTPGSETRDGEGSHVPYEMAKIYRSNKESWRTLKQALEKYGHQSEMFKEVGIKSFGNSASDPFQVQFQIEGPKMNIIDLGYGTSQVLPILYTVSTGSKSVRYLIQQPEVHLHPKAQAALGSFFIDAMVGRGNNFVLETHSDFIVDRARQAIASGILRSDQVSVLFFQKGKNENTINQIELDKNGIPISPPPSYRNFFIDEELKSLGVSYGDDN